MPIASSGPMDWCSSMGPVPVSLWRNALAAAHLEKPLSLSVILGKGFVQIFCYKVEFLALFNIS